MFGKPKSFIKLATQDWLIVPNLRMICSESRISQYQNYNMLLRRSCVYMVAGKHIVNTVEEKIVFSLISISNHKFIAHSRLGLLNVTIRESFQSRITNTWSVYPHNYKLVSDFLDSECYTFSLYDCWYRFHVEHIVAMWLYILRHWLNYKRLLVEHVQSGLTANDQTKTLESCSRRRAGQTIISDAQSGG